MAQIFMNFSRREIWGMSLLAVCFVTLVTSLATWIQGHVTGTEFAASHFQTRSFEFYQIPLIKLQVTPIWRKSSTTPVMQYLSTQTGFLTIPTKPPREWDLVTVSTFSSFDQFPTDASLLVTTLENTNSSNWEDWSKANPRLARSLWPNVQYLAQQDLYFLIPQVLQFAQSHTDRATFDDQLKDLIATEIVGLAADLRAAGSTVQADELLKEGQRHDPANPRYRTALQAIPADA